MRSRKALLILTVPAVRGRKTEKYSSLIGNMTWPPPPPGLLTMAPLWRLNPIKTIKWSWNQMLIIALDPKRSTSNRCTFWKCIAWISTPLTEQSDASVFLRKARWPQALPFHTFKCRFLLFNLSETRLKILLLLIWCLSHWLDCNCDCLWAVQGFGSVSRLDSSYLLSA